MSDGSDGETGYLRRASADGYAELARPAVVRPRRTVVISSTDGRWQRHPPRHDDLTWNPSTLAQIDRFWQGYQRDWVHRLNARHVIATGAPATSCTATNPTSSPASSPTSSTPPAPGKPSTSTRAPSPTAAAASCRGSEEHTGSCRLLRNHCAGHPGPQPAHGPRRPRHQLPVPRPRPRRPVPIAEFFLEPDRTRPLIFCHAAVPIFPFGSRLGIRPRNIPPSSSPLSAGYDRAPRGAPCNFPRSPFSSRVSHQIPRHLLSSLPATRAIQRCASWRSYNTHRPHRSLDQHPPTGRTPLPSRATVRPLRRDRLAILVHEYLQVA